MRLALLAALGLVATACADDDPIPEVAARTPAAPVEGAGKVQSDEINPRLLRRFQPVVGQGGAAAISPAKVALGRMLYFDARLSRGHDLSCNSCHDLASHGDDGKSSSVGHKGRKGSRNAPSVFNSASHIAQFWDGRSESVEQQASMPILNPDEMANTSERVLQTLRSIPGYVEMFRGAYPGVNPPITMETVGDAIGAFERGLTTRSRWDEFIAGKPDALSAEEKRGLRLFMDVGCLTCHTGPQVGASMYQLVGVVVPWPNQSDLGRAQFTKLDADRMQFKVPSLKNIAETGPYFHDGSAATLEDAIRMMGRHQVGLELTDDEVRAIATWMKSLTGTIDPSYIAAPKLPPSGPRTPPPIAD